MHRFSPIAFRMFAMIFVVVTTTTTLFAQGVSFDKTGDGLVVLIDGEEFTRYRTSSELPKPFFHPVMVDGIDLTRPIDPNEKEHPHHKGIWVSVDEVNKIQFWAEKGKIVNTSVQWSSGTTVGMSDCWRSAVARYEALGFRSPVSVSAKASRVGVLRVVNHWLGADEKPVVIEDTTIEIHPNKLMCYEITFKAPGQNVEFEDTKEGLLGFRMAHSMREKEGGRVLAANGVKGSKENWGQPNDWIDYFGEVNGKTVGVTLMDHPGNLRPSRYHVRDYGLFSISPFGDKAYTGGKEEEKVLHLAPGESVTLRYGIYFHGGDTKEGGVEAAYQQFLEATK